MYIVAISLSSVESVKKFVNIASKYKFPITLHSDNYIINGKSIMGIFSLDLSKPLTLKVEQEVLQSFIDEISQFIVNEE